MLKLRVGDEGEITGTVSHGGAGDPLQDCNSLKLYVRKVGASSNLIDGEEVDSFSDDGSFQYTIDLAAVAPGTYRAYLLAHYTDNSEWRFPNDADEEEEILVAATYE